MIYNQDLTLQMNSLRSNSLKVGMGSIYTPRYCCKWEIFWLTPHHYWHCRGICEFLQCKDDIDIHVHTTYSHSRWWRSWKTPAFSVVMWFWLRNLIRINEKYFHVSRIDVSKHALMDFQMRNERKQFWTEKGNGQYYNVSLKTQYKADIHDNNTDKTKDT